MRFVVLGCGFHGRGIAYQLAGFGPAIDLTVLDRDDERALAVGRKAGVSWGALDVTDGPRLREVLAGADVVVNAVGPYHRTALGVIEAAIDTGAHYVDMNDDHEVAEAVLLDPVWDQRARRAGVTVLIDCGVVPGLSGLMVRHAAEQLDRTDRVDVRFGWNYRRDYPAAIHHFLRINNGAGPQFVDGRHVRMPPFEGREEFEFLEPVGSTPVHFTGVPDPVAVARFLPGVQRATAKGAFYQAEANRLVEDMVRWGFTADERPVAGQPGPVDYLMAYLASPRGERYFDIPRRDLPLAVRVEVAGSRSGEPVTVRYEAHDRSRRATTTFTALAALAVARGELGPGVAAPEAWPHPTAFLRELLPDEHIRIWGWRDDEPARPLEIE
jgi:lysine 6-dehydrogenase